MKQVVFISGKGGTGKSTLVSSLSHLVNDKILADCDVEAPNMHILLQGKIIQREDFFGAQEAVIDKDICTKCGLCREACRFDAIDEEYNLRPMKCEGCGACVLVCPVKAIKLKKVKTGETFVSKTPQGIFSHALLDIGAEGSGLLVTEVREKVKDYYGGETWLLIDGSPGIGCTVIASITGTDAVVIVSEPTISGRSDLERVLALAKHFKIPAFVCINKYDLNLQVTEEIEEFCRASDVPVVGKIPFDPSVVKALQEFKTPVEADNKEFTALVKDIWLKITKELKELAIK